MTHSSHLITANNIMTLNSQNLLTIRNNNILQVIQFLVGR